MGEVEEQASQDKRTSVAPRVAEPGAAERAAVLGRMTHEIAAPVGVLAGALRELRTQVGGDRAAERLLRLADRAVARMLRLSRELHEAANLEALNGVRAPLRWQQVDFRNVIRAGVEQASATHPRADEVLDVVLPDEPVPARVDLAQMTRVVDILVASALRCAETSVRIRLHVPEGDDAILFFVEDDGVPIPQAYQHDLFARFAARPPTGRDRDSVFGLSIAHDYVAAQGGELSAIAPRADGRPERRGARMQVRLPRL